MVPSPFTIAPISGPNAIAEVKNKGDVTCWRLTRVSNMINQPHGLLIQPTTCQYLCRPCLIPKLWKIPKAQGIGYYAIVKHMYWILLSKVLFMAGKDVLSLRKAMEKDRLGRLRATYCSELAPRRPFFHKKEQISVALMALLLRRPLHEPVAIY